MVKISQLSIKNWFVLLPFKKNQIKIANYLDEKTEIIDKQLFLLKEKKEKYKELKQVLINDVVTKGLNPNVKFKDSGIEWIGEIPEHWNINRLKNIFNERIEKNLKNNGKPITSNILSVIKDIGVINHRDKKLVGKLVGNKISKDITKYKLVYVDDIVINRMNIMIGSVGISCEFGALSVIYIILKTKPIYSSRYYNYFFKIKKFQKNLRKISTGILEIREAVNMDLFTAEDFPIPPLKEQTQIANYLDEKTEIIDNIIKTIDKKIEMLKEFRKTLINDVVTGKVKV